jgi:hypothetical protein
MTKQDGWAFLDQLAPGDRSAATSKGVGSDTATLLASSYLLFPYISP